MPLSFWNDAFATTVFLINRLPTSALSGRVYISRHVRFDESLFPYKNSSSLQFSTSPPMISDSRNKSSSVSASFHLWLNPTLSSPSSPHSFPTVPSSSIPDSTFSHSLDSSPTTASPLLPPPSPPPEHSPTTAAPPSSLLLPPSSPPSEHSPTTADAPSSPLLPPQSPPSEHFPTTAAPSSSPLLSPPSPPSEHSPTTAAPSSSPLLPPQSPPFELSTTTAAPFSSPLLPRPFSSLVHSSLPHVVQNDHPVVTRGKRGIFKPKEYHVKSLHKELVDVYEAFQDPSWVAAVQAEYKALIQNGTCGLQPLPSHRKPVGYKWLFKIKSKVWCPG